MWKFKCEILTKFVRNLPWLNPKICFKILLQGLEPIFSVLQSVAQSLEKEYDIQGNSFIFSRS